MIGVFAGNGTAGPEVPPLALDAVNTVAVATADVPGSFSTVPAVVVAFVPFQLTTYVWDVVQETTPTCPTIDLPVAAVLA